MSTPEPASVAAAKERVIESARDETRYVWGLNHDPNIPPVSALLVERVKQLASAEQQAAPATPRYTIVNGNIHLDGTTLLSLREVLALLNAREPAPSSPDLRAAAERCASAIMSYGKDAITDALVALMEARRD